MATKPADTTTPATATPATNTVTATTAPEAAETLKISIVELLNEFSITARNLNPKKATVRQIKRSLATIDSIIAELKEELK